MMKRYSPTEITHLLQLHGLLPLLNPDSVESGKKVLQAAYDGGVRMFECTNRSPQSLAIFRELAPFAEKNMPDLVLGAGTILDAKAAKEFYEAGAKFLVAPVISEDVAAFCKHHDIFWCPGAATLNEIIRAHALGAEVVKIFPANFVGGPEFVKAIKAPCPHIRVMPTGGVDDSEKNLRAWFEAGVHCVGIGSHLFTKELLAAQDYATLTQRTRAIVRCIQSIKGIAR